MKYLMIPEHHFDRRWTCRVVSSGYHNGAHCTPSEPHNKEVWSCGYRTTISMSDLYMESVERYEDKSVSVRVPITESVQTLNPTDKE